MINIKYQMSSEMNQNAIFRGSMYQQVAKVLKPLTCLKDGEIKCSEDDYGNRNFIDYYRDASKELQRKYHKQDTEGQFFIFFFSFSRKARSKERAFQAVSTSYTKPVICKNWLQCNTIIRCEIQSINDSPVWEVRVRSQREIFRNFIYG